MSESVVLGIALVLVLPSCKTGEDEVPLPFGAPCQSNDRCLSKLCLPSGICSGPCAGPSDCPPGPEWSCAESPGLGNRCKCKASGAAETCDGHDNDCNAVVDDGATCPNALHSCQAGTCQCAPDNLCGAECVDKASSTANCGACGNPCPTGATCVTGSCKCPSGTTECGGACAPTTTDSKNCGGCGKVCSSVNGTPSCTNGVCGVACSAGFGDCDAVASNGCEATLATDAKNCGGCGKACSSANGTPSCTNGVCAIVCSAGFGNCDNNVANGCETNLKTDKANCGQCAKACQANEACLNGQCGGCVTDVAAHTGSTCARRADGTLWCWGRNDYGQLGDGTSDGQACGSYKCKPSPVQVAALGAGAAEVAPGAFHTCARKSDGTLWCWGLNGDGQLGDGTTGGQSCGGSPCKPTPVQVVALGNTVVGIAVNGSHTCARKQDGTVWCWGWNANGQIGDGTTINKASPVKVVSVGTAGAEIAAGYGHACARKTDGTLWCWGGNWVGQLGDGTTTVGGLRGAPAPGGKRASAA